MSVPRTRSIFDLPLKATVLVSGYFDPLHRGHINYFREAKKFGDKLFVHIHRDECVKRKKGYCFMPLVDRVAILRSIKYVDNVWICNSNCDGTVVQALEMLKPDIFAKGGDREPSNMPKAELEICEKLGIKIVYGVGGSKIQSSSWLTEKLKEEKRKEVEG